MTVIQIRDYEEPDWPRSREIHDLARPVELEGSCDPHAFVPLADDKDDLTQFLEAKKFVAHRDDRIVGFVGTEATDIGWLYVDPAETRQGIGRILLQHAIDHIHATAPGKPISVYVLGGNIPAQTLYRSEGFSLVREFQSENNGYPCAVQELKLVTNR